MANLHQRAWLAWASVSLLGVFCTVLAVLQYRWTGEISGAEGARLKAELHTRLDELSRRFNTVVTNAAYALFPPDDRVEQAGREVAYSEMYLRWKDSHERLFNRIALAVPEEHGVQLLMMNLDTARFATANWPQEWQRTNGRLTRTLEERMGPPPTHDGALLVLPRFGHFRDRAGGEQEWLLLELNLDYFRNMLLPDLLNRYLGEAGRLDYDAQVIQNGNPPAVIYNSASAQSYMDDAPDATVPLFEIGRGPGPGRPRPHDGSNPGPPPPMRRGRPPIDDGPGGYWTLRVRNKAGSLEALVARARWRNLLISAGMLLLILATVALLVRFSRQAQQLAQQQMNFVAGVSHELRTPLTVIRTAAYNLRGRLANRPDQVERYGALIQAESEKLTNIVEQVLQFASAKAGHAIREREPVTIEALIEEGLRASRASLQNAKVVLEEHLEPDLPMVLADQMAMQHALRNLVDNALKYGTEGSNWIGVFASAVEQGSGQAVEIRVADHGPGIPRDEQDRIFEPFYRGRRAVDDQVHGTGLGLNLVKKIVEAHGGTIRVKSEPMKGTEFVIRIPALEAAL